MTKVTTYGIDTATSLGAELTGNPSAHVKGTYVEITAATTAPANGIIVILTFATTGSRHFLVDIAIGSGGNETVILPNLFYGSMNNRGVATPYFFPISIPSGTRITARCQCSTTTEITVKIGVQLVYNELPPFATLGRVTTLGADTAATGGSLIDPGGTANTKGAWTELEDSTTYPIRMFYLAVFPDTTSAAYADDAFLLDIGVGAAGSEQVIVPNYSLMADTFSNDIYPRLLGPFWYDIPAGTRVAVRAQCSVTTSDFDAIIYGVS